MCAGSPGGMRVTEARFKESVFNGASRGRRYGGRRIERRPTAHLAFARGGGDDDASRIIKKKSGLSPQSIEGHFLVRFCVGQNTTNSFDEERRLFFFFVFTLQILERASARLLHGSFVVVVVVFFEGGFIALGVAPPPLQHVWGRYMKWRGLFSKNKKMWFRV